MSDQRLRMVTSRSGLPGVEVEGTSYHSRYDPVREAEKFVTTFPIHKADVVLVFGWGLGYLSSALLPRLKQSVRVIVFEPDDALFKLAQRPADNRFRFCNRGRKCANFSTIGCPKTVGKPTNSCG